VSSASIVDASVWVSRLVSLDVHQALSRQWLEQQMAEAAHLVSPVLLLSEVAGAISRRTGDPALARQAINNLLRLPALRIVPIDHHLGSDSAYLAADLGLRKNSSLYLGSRTT
jgi:predicted nucleic acid-binding protein